MKKKGDVVIGILGGFGSYATSFFFNMLLDLFPAEKEWDRPRILIDNRCTMPSRVRAIIYDEKVDEVIAETKESLDMLINAGANYIIVACCTAHYFLDMIIRENDEYGKYIVNIVDETINYMIEESISEYYLLATEGTFKAGIFNRKEDSRLSVHTPETDEEQKQIRYMIEAVKTNDVSDKVINDFCKYCEQTGYKTIVLGCTELPVIYSKCKNFFADRDIMMINPLEVAAKKIKEIYEKV